ncbi:hypothetical protein [Methylobacterium oryzae]|uniref:hypothetical protein n=1 Tax=Methylobacterium oryzae TaxID=334852 RepID=UPI002F33E8EA
MILDKYTADFIRSYMQPRFDVVDCKKARSIFNRCARDIDLMIEAQKRGLNPLNIRMIERKSPCKRVALFAVVAIGAVLFVSGLYASLSQVYERTVDLATEQTPRTTTDSDLPKFDFYSPEEQ